jgi:hypothetical protein
MNTGVTGSPFTPISSYSSGALTHTLDFATDSIITGTIYTFRYFAKNIVGDGLASSEISIAMVDSPAKPTLISQVIALSTTTSISLSWNSVSDGVAPGGTITGYVLTA